MQQLIQYFQKVSEPTVIVFFGDHQPRVGSDFYNALYGKTSSALTKEETNRKYQVPFMIWANYPIQEKQKVEISANYLSSYLLQQTGGKMTGYNKYLMSLHQKIPVLTDIAYRDTEGNTYNVDDPDSQYADLVRQYQQIQYNGFDDRKHQQKQFFYLKK